MTWWYLVTRVTVTSMLLGPALRVWETQNVGVARFDVLDGNLVLDRIDSPTHMVKLNPVWLHAQGFGHHVEDDGATIRVGDHVFRRVQVLREPFAAYELTAGSMA